MLFNSNAFIFLFLPVALAIYYRLGLSRLHWLRRPFLILATLVFYGLGGWGFVPLLLASAVLNYIAGTLIDRYSHRGSVQFWILATAICGNVALLAYFKYFNFVLRSLNSMLDSGYVIENLALPLGISFFTFQQIGYLVDVARGKNKAGSPLDYANFVLFFPQLLAGPIVYYRETVPQLVSPVVRGAIGKSILIGLVIFAIGLFKKTVVADTAALYASPVFDAAREGSGVGFLESWVGAFAYTAQVYFDFSGYSDMAIGTARMFGIVLPLNFHSPLRSASVVEIWRRWHITLGRWVQSYVFQPLTLPLARFAAGRRMGNTGTLAFAVVIPTLVSMLVVGIWHGPAWTFVLFGLMQGIYMSVNEVWASIRRKPRKARKKAGLAPPRWHRPLAVAATLIAFVVSVVPFGSVSLDHAQSMFAAMAGIGSATGQADVDWPMGSSGALAILAAIYAGIFLLPNTQQIMGRFEPVLEWSERWQGTADAPIMVHWRMTAGWTLAATLVFFLGVSFIMRGTTQFIYFNF